MGDSKRTIQEQQQVIEVLLKGQQDEGKLDKEVLESEQTQQQRRVKLGSSGVEQQLIEHPLQIDHFVHSDAGPEAGRGGWVISNGVADSESLPDAGACAGGEGWGERPATSSSLIFEREAILSVSPLSEPPPPIHPSSATPPTPSSSIVDRLVLKGICCERPFVKMWKCVEMTGNRMCGRWNQYYKTGDTFDFAVNDMCTHPAGCGKHKDAANARQAVGAEQATSSQQQPMIQSSEHEDAFHVQYASSSGSDGCCDEEEHLLVDICNISHETQLSSRTPIAWRGGESLGTKPFRENMAGSRTDFVMRITQHWQQRTVGSHKHTHTRTHIHTCTHIRNFTHIRTHARTHINTPACMCIHTYILTHTYVNQVALSFDGWRHSAKTHQRLRISSSRMLRHWLRRGLAEVYQWYACIACFVVAVQ